MTRLRQVLVAAGVGAALVATAPAVRGQADSSPPGLESIFRIGAFLQDSNGDEVIDFVAASIVLGDTPSLDEIAGASDIAARFGFETMAMDLPVRRQSTEGPIVAIGPAGLQRAGVTASSLDARPLAAGQGLVALTMVNNRQVIAVTGGLVVFYWLFPAPVAEAANAAALSLF